MNTYVDKYFPVFTFTNVTTKKLQKNLRIYFKTGSSDKYFVENDKYKLNESVQGINIFLLFCCLFLLLPKQLQETIKNLQIYLKTGTRDKCLVKNDKYELNEYDRAIISLFFAFTKTTGKIQSILHILFQSRHKWNDKYGLWIHQDNTLSAYLLNKITENLHKRYNCLD